MRSPHRPAVLVLPDKEKLFCELSKAQSLHDDKSIGKCCVPSLSSCLLWFKLADTWLLLCAAAPSLFPFQ
jgi:hypothetical protein